MNRRGFLKGLSAIALIPIAIKDVVADKKLTHLEKAEKIDKDFDSPYLYVQASEDLKQGDVVTFDYRNKKNSYTVRRVNSTRSKAVGISTTDVKKDSWYFIQTAGHCTLPANPNNYFKSFSDS